jgi:hypothetical protein
MIFNNCSLSISLTSLSNHKSIGNSRAIRFGKIFQLIGALASAAAGAYGASKSARVSQQNAREQRAWQTEMSNTAHTREIADLRKNFWKFLMEFCEFLEVPHVILSIFGSSSWDFVQFWMFLVGFCAFLEVPRRIVHI